jgi:hypothetical protein
MGSAPIRATVARAIRVTGATDEMKIVGGTIAYRAIFGGDWLPGAAQRGSDKNQDDEEGEAAEQMAPEHGASPFKSAWISGTQSI